MAATPSPYQLATRKAAGPAVPYLAVTLSEEEKLEKLEGYFAVPKDYWPFVKYGTHVRYAETAAKGGEFRVGGFVVKNPFDTKVGGKGPEIRFLKLQNSFTKTVASHREWLVAYSDIEFLYVKGTGVELALQKDLASAVSTLSANIQRLADYSKKLEARIAVLEKRG